MKNQTERYYNNERYAAIETLYLATKEDKYLEQMYDFLAHYYTFKLKKYVRQKGLYFTEERMNELSHDMATRSICHYKEHPRIKGEFRMCKLSAYAQFDFMKILYEQPNETSIEEHNINIPVTTNEEERIDMLLDAQRNLPALEYKIAKTIVYNQNINVDDLANLYELPKKSIMKSLERIKEWKDAYNEIM